MVQASIVTSVGTPGTLAHLKLLVLRWDGMPESYFRTSIQLHDPRRQLRAVTNVQMRRDAPACRGPVRVGCCELRQSSPRLVESHGYLLISTLLVATSPTPSANTQTTQKIDVREGGRRRDWTRTSSESLQVFLAVQEQGERCGARRTLPTPSTTGKACTPRPLTTEDFSH